MRIVLDLKSEVKPDLFALTPVAEYGHRLVLDLYPQVPLDPLMALLESERAKEATAAAQPQQPPQAPRRAVRPHAARAVAVPGA